MEELGFVRKVLLSIGIASTIWLSTLGQHTYASDQDLSVVIQTSKQYIGVPYKYGGTTPSGFDCSGYIQYVFKKVGVQLPRTAADMYHSKKLVSVKTPQPGDIVFFETYKPGPSHVGLYLGNQQFIHASSSYGVTVTSMNKSYWTSRFLGAKRLKDEVIALSVKNEVEEIRKLWEQMVARYKTVEDINGLDANLLKQYQKLSQAVKQSGNQESSEYLLRTANMIDAVKVGMQLDQERSEFQEELIQQQQLNNSTVQQYDEFSAAIRKNERVISRLYGQGNRQTFASRFITPAKIAKETVIYEVSMYRLMDKIEVLIEQQNITEAKDKFAMLERLEKRAAEIKAKGNSLHPGKYSGLEQMHQTLQQRKQSIMEKLNISSSNF
jgi:NlpC/P60 family/SbsC C-terminal domain